MNDFDDFDDEDFDFGDNKEVDRFEAMLQNDQSLFFDLSTIFEIYGFYRVRGDFEKALKLIEYGLTQYPHEANLYYKKADTLLEEGEMEKAMDAINQAIQLKTHPKFVILKSKIFMAMGLTAKAISLLKETLTWTPNPWEIWYQLGATYNMVHSFKEAAECYGKAFALQPDNEEILLDQVFCLELSGALDEGIEVYTKYLDDNPYSYPVWYNIGILYARLGLHEKAIDAYDFCLAIEEDFASAWYNKGCSLMELGKFEEAIRVFLEALRNDKQDASVMFSIAECYEGLSDHANARYYFRKVTTLAPDMADAWYGIGYSLEMEEKYFEAIHYYRKAIQADQDHFDSWISLAFCEYHAGNEASALEALEEAIRLNPEDGELWQEWSMLMKEEGKYDQAMDILQEGITNNPEQSELYYLYAGMCFLTGKSREGMVYLENALIMDYNRHVVLFEYFMDLKQFQPVVELIRQYKRK
jgi:tetratricopeptide (TPR) repeat protein